MTRRYKVMYCIEVEANDAQDAIQQAHNEGCYEQNADYNDENNYGYTRTVKKTIDAVISQG